MPTTTIIDFTGNGTFQSPSVEFDVGGFDVVRFNLTPISGQQTVTLGIGSNPVSIGKAALDAVNLNLMNVNSTQLNFGVFGLNQTWVDYYSMHPESDFTNADDSDGAYFADGFAFSGGLPTGATVDAGPDYITWALTGFPNFAANMTFALDVVFNLSNVSAGSNQIRIAFSADGTPLADTVAAPIPPAAWLLGSALFALLGLRRRGGSTRPS